MGYCARLSALEEHHRFLNSESPYYLETLVRCRLAVARLLTQGGINNAAPLNLLPCSAVATLCLSVTLDAPSFVHTDYWSFVSRLHSGRADSVLLAKAT